METLDSMKEFLKNNNVHIQNIDDKRNYWFVRTDGGNYFDAYISGSYVALGWNDVPLTEPDSKGSYPEDLLKEIEAKKPEKMEINATEEELNNAKNNIEEFLKEFFEKAKINAKIKIEIKDKCIYVTINGENIGNLIGYRGDALYALENLLKAVANKNSENRIIVRLDIEDYKQKREETLKEFALKKASIVEKTGKTMTLEPMKAYERKIIHTVLQENSKVETRSIGEEPKRRIVITKK